MRPVTSRNVRGVLRARGLLLAFVAGSLLSPAPARAVVVCIVKKSSAEAVTLRARPDHRAPLVARMKRGDGVHALQGDEPRDGWTRVRWWKAATLRRHGANFEKIDVLGWTRYDMSDSACD